VQAGSVQLRAIVSVLDSMLGSVIESVLTVDFVAYRQAGWEYIIECYWEFTGEIAQECD
jgi:hypothetical protein